MKGQNILFACTLLSVFVLGGCSEAEIEPPAVLGAAGELYVSLGCARCHGAELEGRRTAPPMTGLAKHWSSDTMVAFFKDPKSFTDKDPRLQMRSESYPVFMPPVVSATDDQLKLLADALIAVP